MNVTVELTVNGKARSITTHPERSLLEVLREDLHLTGTKYGCGEALCGACTVLLDDRPARSCVVLMGDVHGRSVTTIEKLAEGGALHALQEAFLAEGAMQCGYCTPGMILSAAALLEADPEPTDERIVKWMNGNICRCNGYPKILNAIRRAAGGR